MAKFINCKGCGLGVDPNSKDCPKCGAKVLKPLHKKAWFWLVMVFATPVVWVMFIFILGTLLGLDKEPSVVDTQSVIEEESQMSEEEVQAEIKAKEEAEAIAKAEREKAEAIAKAEQEEAEAIAKAEQEEADRKALEAKEESYNSGITFDNLARNPDTYKSQNVKFTGKIIQVVEGRKKSTYRLAVDEDYDKIIFLEISAEQLKDNRILEDDILTIKGSSDGVTSYSSVLGGKITIPKIIVDSFTR